jgi:hypothetical protein
MAGVFGEHLIGLFLSVPSVKTYVDDVFNGKVPNTCP